MITLSTLFVEDVKSQHRFCKEHDITPVVFTHANEEKQPVAFEEAGCFWKRIFD